MLSWISSDFFARSPVLIFPLIALGIFMVVFVASALRAWRTDPNKLDRMADMPLHDELTEGEVRDV